jgi:hypothetical protein
MRDTFDSLLAVTDSRPAPATDDTGGATPRELAERRSGEIDVLLLWHPDFDRIELCVLDLATGVSLHVDVPPGKALDAFNHPYAYVTQRTPDPRRETDSATTR